MPRAGHTNIWVTVVIGLLGDRSINGGAVFENGKREECPGSLEVPLAVLRAIPSERGLDIAWRREGG